METVDNKTAIFRYIRKQPGAYYSQIQRELNLASGVLAYHLKAMKDARLIESRHDGYLTRYYPDGIKYTPVGLTPKQREMAEIISRKRGITNRQLCKMLGKTKQTVQHHVKNLIEKGVVMNLEEDGRWLLYPASGKAKQHR